MGLMKMDHDRHYFAHAQTTVSLPLDFACGKDVFLPDRQESLTKVIDITKHFE